MQISLRAIISKVPTTGCHCVGGSKETLSHFVSIEISCLALASTGNSDD